MRPGALPKAKDVVEALRPMPTAETKHASPPLGARGCEMRDATSVLRNERHAATLATHSSRWDCRSLPWPPVWDARALLSATRQCSRYPLSSMHSGGAVHWITTLRPPQTCSHYHHHHPHPTPSRCQKLPALPYPVQLSYLSILRSLCPHDFASPHNFRG
jgi:hypothetical protein